MKVKVKLIPSGKELDDTEVEDDANGQALLEKLGLAPDAHIITRAGSPIPLDEELKEGDEIHIIKVVSGG